jgi:GH15 family glucan-1,4-alpha-glucosidase
MPRDIPVGNGRFLITFDQDYCLRDIYYPYVGKENHTAGHRFRFGIWADGRKVNIKNLRKKRRQFRIFFHHDFHILGSAIGDTAYFDPEENALIHYKGI